MKPLCHEDLRGNWAAVLLPINTDDSIDFARLADEVALLASMPLSGVYVNGTACEFYSQSDAEFDRIAVLLAETCTTAGRPFQIGVSDTNPWVSLDRIRRVKALKPGAVQVILPDWYAVSDDEAVAFLERMAAAADPIGLVLYNPPHAKRVLTPSEIGRLKRAVPSLVGVKVADGDAAWYADMAAQVPGVAVFVPGHRLATGYARGAHGAYSNVACLHPLAAQRWYDLMGQDIEAALELETRIQRFIVGHIVPYMTEQRYAPQALDKFMAAIGGWAQVGSRLRWPYRWIPESEADRLRPTYRELLPEFAEG